MLGCPQRDSPASVNAARRVSFHEDMDGFVLCRLCIETDVTRMTVKLAAKNAKHHRSRNESSLLNAGKSGVLGLHTAQKDDIQIVALPQFVEGRGTLLPFDFETMPFIPKRVFVVNDVPAGTVRGQHAHRRGQQLLVRLAGEIRVEVRRHGRSKTVSLVNSRSGLLVPAGVWAAQTYVTFDAALLVLCSEPYDSTSYVDANIA
jgi:dTDP-4-dehydrorhamnose 3,5-epimerase-like enzyme